MAVVPNILYPDPISPFEAPLYTYRAGDDVNITFAATYPYTKGFGLSQICGNNIGDFPNKTYDVAKSSLYSYGQPIINSSSYIVVSIPANNILGPICLFAYYNNIVFGAGLDNNPVNGSLSGFFKYVNTSSGNPTLWSYIPTSTSTTTTSTSSPASTTALTTTSTTTTSTNSPSLSMASATASAGAQNNPLSQAAKVGIGIGVPLAVLLLFVIGIVLYLFWSKKSVRMRGNDAAIRYEKPELDAQERKTAAVDPMEAVELSNENQAPRELEGTPVGFGIVQRS